MSERYDAVVIGTGQAGPALAVRLARVGRRTAIASPCGADQDRRRMTPVLRFSQQPIDSAVQHPNNHIHKEGIMNPLDSLWGTIIAGVVLTVILYFVVRALMGA